jgi:cell division protein FtsB
LSNTSLDLDMLEERARVMLNYAHPDDLIIFLNQAVSNQTGARAVN